MRRRSFFIAISLSGALFLFYGCDDESPAGFRYPLAVGNQWEYNRKWDTFYYADSNASTYDDTTTMLSSVQVVVTDKASLAGTSGLYRMAAAESDSLDSYEGIQYYGQDDDGLYSYGHEGSALISMPKGLPAQEGQGGIYFKGMYFSNVTELSRLLQEALPELYLYRKDSTELIIEDPPVEVLRYPLKQGTTWTLRETHDPWRIDKLVAGEEEIVVPAGTFECYRIEYLYDLDDNGEWDTDIFIIDHIGEVGLTQREITLLGMIRTDDFGERVGYMDCEDMYALEAVSLEE